MKTEKTLFVIFIVGFLLKLLHIPGSGPIIVLSVGLLSLLYFPGGFYFLGITTKVINDSTFTLDEIATKEIKETQNNIPFSIISGFFLSGGVIGILFKILHFPGAQPMLLVGCLSVTIITIISFIARFHSSENLKKYYNNMCLRLSIYTAISLTLFFM